MVCLTEDLNFNNWHNDLNHDLLFFSFVFLILESNKKRDWTYLTLNWHVCLAKHKPVQLFVITTKQNKAK